MNRERVRIPAIQPERGRGGRRGGGVAREREGRSEPSRCWNFSL